MLDMRFVMCHAVKIETHSNSKGSAKAHDVHIRCDSRCIDQIYDHFFLLAFAVSLQSIDHIILSIYLIVIAVEKKKKTAIRNQLVAISIRYKVNSTFLFLLSFISLVQCDAME